MFFVLFLSRNLDFLTWKTTENTGNSVQMIRISNLDFREVFVKIYFLNKNWIFNIVCIEGGEEGRTKPVGKGRLNQSSLVAEFLTFFFSLSFFLFV